MPLPPLLNLPNSQMALLHTNAKDSERKAELFASLFVENLRLDNAGESPLKLHVEYSMAAIQQRVAPPRHL